MPEAFDKVAALRPEHALIASVRLRPRSSCTESAKLVSAAADVGEACGDCDRGSRQDWGRRRSSTSRTRVSTAASGSTTTRRPRSSTIITSPATGDTEVRRSVPVPSLPQTPPPARRMALPLTASPRTPAARSEAASVKCCADARWLHHPRPLQPVEHDPRLLVFRPARTLTGPDGRKALRTPCTVRVTVHMRCYKRPRISSARWIPL